jgi:hypothetical protein
MIPGAQSPAQSLKTFLVAFSFKDNGPDEWFRTGIFFCHFFDRMPFSHSTSNSSNEIPKEKRDLAAQEVINTENKQNVTVQLTNPKTGESHLRRLPITGNRQIYLPTEIQEMLKEYGRIRIQILGG